VSISAWCASSDETLFNLQAVAQQADRPDDGKCLHHYFYFVDEELGLCHVRTGIHH